MGASLGVVGSEAEELERPMGEIPTGVSPEVLRFEPSGIE
jgi:hypothetical protein